MTKDSHYVECILSATIHVLKECGKDFCKKEREFSKDLHLIFCKIDNALWDIHDKVFYHLFPHSHRLNLVIFEQVGADNILVHRKKVEVGFDVDHVSFKELECPWHHPQVPDNHTPYLEVELDMVVPRNHVKLLNQFDISECKRNHRHITQVVDQPDDLF